MSHLDSPAPEQGDQLSLDAPECQVGAASSATTLLTTAIASAALAACGGGEADPAAQPGADGLAPASVIVWAWSKPTQLDAWRFLNQATFGPSVAEADALMSTGYVSWLDAQFTMTKSVSMLNLTTTNYTTKLGPIYGLLHREHVSSAWWEKAMTSPDQLRARVAFALSEILVVGLIGGSLAEFPYMGASYYDVLLDGAFGDFRTLLKNVAAHPTMGIYLSHMSNRKPAGNRIPDQNFAREIMQLFSIGLYKLDVDGTVLKDANGKPIETYTPYDVEVLSHVFTGWGWQHQFDDWFPRLEQVPSQTTPMKAYPEWHSTRAEFPKKDASGKVLRFPNATSGTITLLGKTLTISATSNPEADRQAALDIILSHQNVAPFIAKQMIQKLVTSNPSAAYVKRVASAFKTSSGKLDMQAMIKAILVDTEARDVVTVRVDANYGKLREPLLRVTQFLRAFQVKSVGNKYRVGSLQSTADQLGQSPMESPSVFNFYRPGYVAPNSEMSKQSLVSPEMQISSETEVAAYVRFMELLPRRGLGGWVDLDGNAIVKDVTPESRYSPVLSLYPTFAEELKASVDTTKTTADRAKALIDLLSRKLLGGAMSQNLRTHLTKVAQTLPFDTDTSAWSYAQRRIVVLSMLIAISPEYVVQR
jgi:uncharacterized protein (DUF1800 family)